MRVGGTGASSCGRTNLPIPEFYRNAAADLTRASAPCASLSGRRALEFVLRNTANVDKSLLFDVEILAVEGDRSVGFRRGPGAWAEGVAGNSADAKRGTS